MPTPRRHRYHLQVDWTGNLGSGTRTYDGYSRSHTLAAPGKLPIIASADTAFRGDGSGWNPEELLVAALAQCHMLSFLHVATDAGVEVVAYTDSPEGVMQEELGGGGRFVEVTLHPRVTIARPPGAVDLVALHGRASDLCFIASSINFPVHHEPVTVVAPET